MAMYVGFHLFLEADFLFLDTYEKAAFESLRLQLPERIFLNVFLDLQSTTYWINT